MQYLDGLGIRKLCGISSAQLVGEDYEFLGGVESDGHSHSHSHSGSSS